jgi:hypothetical protein
MNPSRIRLLKSAATLVIVLHALVLRAHPGHSLGDSDAQHLLTSPDHLGVLALGGLGLWFVGRLVQRRLPRRVLQSLGLAALGTAAVLWGFGN